MFSEGRAWVHWEQMAVKNALEKLDNSINV